MSEPSKVAESATPPTALLDSEQAAKIGRSLEESFREDLETLKMSAEDVKALELKVSSQDPEQIAATLIRSWAQGRRADEQVAKLTSIRHILSSTLELCPRMKTVSIKKSFWRRDKVDLTSSISSIIPQIKIALILCRDMSAVWWAPCSNCKHALLDHRSIGGCASRNCSCAERGYSGLTLEELEKL